MFNIMFKTFVGPVEEDAAVVYLRPETAQGMFVNFQNVLNTTRKRLPFGIAQVGKSFRNEITTGNFIFRSREFEQMEMEYFVKPGTDEEWFDYWVEERWNWYINLGIKKEHLNLREHDKEELSHYSKRTVDIDYLYPMGWAELEGVASRFDYDLRQHAALTRQRRSSPQSQTSIYARREGRKPSRGSSSRSGRTGPPPLDLSTASPLTLESYREGGKTWRLRPEACGCCSRGSS